MLFTAKLGMLAAAGLRSAPGGRGARTREHQQRRGYGPTSSGPEVIQGAADGQAAIASNPAVLVWLSGLVWAHGLLVTTSGPPASIYPNRGTPYTTSGNPISQSQHVNPRTRYGVLPETFKVRATGGTGAFWGARGSGQASVQGGSFLPRKPNGMCDPTGNSTSPRAPSSACGVSLADGPSASSPLVSIRQEGPLPEAPFPSLRPRLIRCGRDQMYS